METVMADDFVATPAKALRRWNLKHLAILIAAIAVSFAVVGVWGTVIGLAFFLPAIFARRGQRLRALYWVGNSYPFVVLLSFYVTWIAAWFALGHPPRPSLDDPKDIDLIAAPYSITCLFMFCIPFAFLGSLGLMVARFGKEVGSGSPWSVLCLLITPLSWVAGYGLLVWDPLYVFYWFMD
jgi:hypothetical protein